ncbi:hypothetical protein H5392_01215 [Tessaracoccus sp. MC1865]|uniref:hypothetical protein n=1 Tax=Tessaracoccus sp. MC1865 TaxID=2760310 RepID=UPI0015FEBEA7|nr:hypothetical protein [Tessaracoccus sp. MC1865]MBB1482478.1 hypothetical protein [Tessaracoccus sp. MC1865]QTO38066.1 hypothetical protein J7D54_02865 [Tessaracoccus sp. MC1865]
MTADPLARALALALTGEELPVGSVGTLADELTGLGFTPERLSELRHEAQAAERVWPFPVPLDVRREVGFSRFDAALATARQQLGLTGLVASRPAERPLNRDEQRLVQDRPPHW